MNHQVMTNATLRKCVEEQQKTWNLTASRPQAHSPTSIAKLAPHIPESLTTQWGGIEEKSEV